MFSISNSQWKTTYKKINWQLQANFFTIEEFKELSDRKAYKVIKNISKLEGIKLKREVIKDIVKFIKSDFDGETENVSLLWEFVFDILENKFKESKKIDFVDETFSWIKCYRTNKFELMRN